MTLLQISKKNIELLNYFKLKILSTQKNSKLLKKYTTIWTKKSKVTSKNTLISTKNTRTTVKYRQKTENYHNKDQKIHYINEKNLIITSKLPHDIDLRPGKTTVLTLFFIDNTLEIAFIFLTAL